MTNNTIHFELVSPEEKLVSEPVAMATVPGTEGDMGVGAGHASFVATLRPGVVQLDKDGQDTRHIFIAGGFADITGTQVTILAEEAIDVAAMSQDDLEQTLSNLIEDLDLAEEEADKLRIQGAINMTNEKISAITGKLVT
jgi:F-type H+-transporting ATPase subunit epsilon